jgi:hypothetical protein
MPEQYKQAVEEAAPLTACPICSFENPAESQNCEACYFDLRQVTDLKTDRKKSERIKSESVHGEIVSEPMRRESPNGIIAVVAIFLVAVLVAAMVLSSKKSEPSTSDLEKSVVQCILNKMVSYGVTEGYARRSCLEESGLSLPTG